MNHLFLRSISLVALLASCGRQGQAAQVVADRPAYLDLCKATTGEAILFESKQNGRLSANFYRVGPDHKLQVLASYPVGQTENQPRTTDDPAEADHHMMQWGAHMAGATILDGYRVIFPMKKVQIGAQTGQQMVGQDRLSIRLAGAKWEAVCDELDPHSSEYARFVKELAQ